MADERLIDIESRIAQQEYLLEQLDEVLSSQQARIAKLENACRALAERLESVATDASGGGQSDTDLPPHY